MGQGLRAQGWSSRYQRLAAEKRTLSRSQEAGSAYDIELSPSECHNNVRPCCECNTGTSTASVLSANEPRRSSLTPSTDSHGVGSLPSNELALSALKGNKEDGKPIFENVLMWACVVISATSFIVTLVLSLTAWFHNFDGARALRTATVMGLDWLCKQAGIGSVVILVVTVLCYSKERLFIILHQTYTGISSIVGSLRSCRWTLPEIPLVTCTLMFMYVDQILDGKVMTRLFQDSLYEWAFVLFILLLVPQVVLWMFFYSMKLTEPESLGCVLCLPSVSMVGLTFTLLYPQMSLPWLGDLSVFVACLSLSPVLEVCKCCRVGRRTERAMWMALGEGLLEAAGSAALTLYIMLVTSKSGDWWMSVSVICSILSATRSAASLHFYGNPHATFLEVAWRFAFVCLPRVVSRVTTISFLAYLMRHALLRFVLFLLCEIVGNCLILYLMNNRTTMPSLALFSLIMVFIGSPAFLPSLDEAHFWQAMLQTVLLQTVLLVATIISPFGSESMQILWKDYRCFAVSWVITTAWSTVAAIVIMTQKEALSLQDRIEQANNRLYEAAKSGDRILCSLLLKVEGVERSLANEWVKPKFLPTGDSRVQKWAHSAVHDGRLYAAPDEAESVLVVDLTAEPETVSTIPAQEDKYHRYAGKWLGICCSSGYLYCAPFNHDDVLVIDPVLKSTSTFPSGAPGSRKWYGIASCKEKLYCCPCNHEDVLVIDPKTRKTTLIPTGLTGTDKWGGIVAHNDRLYCCPFNHPDVLVIHPDEMGTSVIPTNISADFKWVGIAACNGKLYCAPFHHDDMLVIDPVSETVSTVPTGCQGTCKWNGVTAIENKVYCAPYNHKDVLVYDTEEKRISFIATGCSGERKWRGITAYNGKLYCAPANHTSVLADAGNIVDHTKLIDEMHL